MSTGVVYHKLHTQHTHKQHTHAHIQNIHYTTTASLTLSPSHLFMVCPWNSATAWRFLLARSTVTPATP